MDGTTMWAEGGGWGAQRLAGGEAVKNRELWEYLLAEVKGPAANGMTVEFWRIPRCRCGRGCEGVRGLRGQLFWSMETSFVYSLEGPLLYPVPSAHQTKEDLLASKMSIFILHAITPIPLGSEIISSRQ